jgi:acyl-CoA synthetase (NDP forming)
VPNFHTPEACADAIAAALRRKAPRLIAARSGHGSAAPCLLDELEAYALFDQLGVPRAPAVALDVGITQAPALPFDYPVAVKALSAQIAHKSDLGGVVLGVREVTALKALAGFRGRPPGDLDALAAALVALSRLAVADGPAIAEAEVNPLIVRRKGQGVVAVDALVRLA